MPTISKEVYYDNVRDHVEIDSGTEGWEWSPSRHMPTYDSTNYSLTAIYYNGANYTSGGFTMPSYNITVSYYFTRKNSVKTYTLEYRSNDGSSVLYTDSGSSSTGSYTFTVRNYAPPPSYCYFVGWATYSGAESASYIGGEDLTVYGTQTLYAVFARYTPTIYKQVFYRESVSEENYSWQKTVTETVTAGYTYNPSLHIPSYDYNYELTEIIDGDGNDYTTGSFTVPTDGKTLLYRFTRRQLTSYLYYNANGGSGAPPTQSGPVDSGSSYSFKVANTEPTRNNYEFQGWAESSDATTPSYYGGDRISVTAGGSKTLWAVWKRLYTFTVEYNANGGNNAPSEQTYSGTESSHTFYVRSSIPMRSGYEFQGWSTSATASTPEYYAGNPISVSAGGTLTLWAVWKLLYSHTLYYNANGGSNAPSTESLTDTSRTHTFTVSTAKPTRTDYEFLGWSTDQNATAASYQGGNGIVVYAEATLYAVWKDTKKALTPSASFRVTAKSDTSLSITVTQTNLEAGTWNFQISTSATFGTFLAANSADWSARTISYTFIGLSANTIYYVRAYNTYGGTTLYSVLSGTARTDIAEFAWTSNDANMVKAGIIPKNAISAVKWNALRSKISEVSQRQGSGVVTYSSAAPNQRITASLFNTVRNAIASLANGGVGAPEEQERGSAMKASLFIALKTAINNAISYVNSNH